ncbi:MAG: pyridoxamine 5'-phosphate oxidase family protein [Bacteroidota bacterium]
MKYNNANIRRQDRLLNEELALVLLKQGEYGVLSIRSENDGVYAVPISYAWDGNQYIYLHGATIGRKLSCIDLYNQVSFCVVGKTQVISNKFTTEYESIILDCFAERNLPKNEQMNALQLLLDKYSPSDKIVGIEYAKKSFHRTEIIRLNIIKWSGKCKNI